MWTGLGSYRFFASMGIIWAPGGTDSSPETCPGFLALSLENGFFKGAASRRRRPPCKTFPSPPRCGKEERQANSVRPGRRSGKPNSDRSRRKGRAPEPQLNRRFLREAGDRPGQAVLGARRLRVEHHLLPLAHQLGGDLLGHAGLLPERGLLREPRCLGLHR